MKFVQKKSVGAVPADPSGMGCFVVHVHYFGLEVRVSDYTLQKKILDDKFLATQKLRLEALRDELIQNADAAASNEEELALESIDQVRDSADSAETMAMEENDEAIFRRNLKRLEVVRRALEKLTQDTYGMSDISGEPIPRARLEAVPEATLNVWDEPPFRQ